MISARQNTFNSPAAVAIAANEAPHSVLLSYPNCCLRGRISDQKLARELEFGSPAKSKALSAIVGFLCQWNCVIEPQWPER